MTKMWENRIPIQTTIYGQVKNVDLKIILICGEKKLSVGLVVFE